jgi:ribosomal protein L16/L10AE
VKPGRVLFEVKSKAKESLLIKEALSFCLRKLPFPGQVIGRFPIL